LDGGLRKKAASAAVGRKTPATRSRTPLSLDDGADQPVQQRDEPRLDPIKENEADVEVEEKKDEGLDEDGEFEVHNKKRISAQSAGSEKENAMPAGNTKTAKSKKHEDFEQKFSLFELACKPP
jgi:hypothetical protein